MRQSVRGVRAVELALADPERAAEFYAKIWNLEIVEQFKDSYWLRGTGRYHHILSLHPSRGRPSIRRVIYDAESEELVDQLFARVSSADVVCESPHKLDWPGGGYGFGFRDPTGRAHAVVAGVADHADDRKVKDRPYKIAHINFNDKEGVRLREFFQNALGFRFVDHAGMQYFLNANSPDHCSVVICESAFNTLNHLSFEMSDLDSVMRSAGRMKDGGYPIEWGVGRHGAAENVFAYFCGPEEMPIEYTADVLQIDENYPFSGPEHWKWPPNRKDQWGVTEPHSPRWKRIQSLFGFDSAYTLPNAKP
nr:VOC family protein [uncultured Acidocella sp.]